jgi:hypothetical protein
MNIRRTMEDFPQPDNPHSSGLERAKKTKSTAEPLKKTTFKRLPGLSSFFGKVFFRPPQFFIGTHNPLLDRNGP